MFSFSAQNAIKFMLSRKICIRIICMYFNSQGYKPFSCFSLPNDFAQTLKWCVCACMCCMTCNKMLEKRLLERCCSPFMLTRTIQILKTKKTWKYNITCILCTYVISNECMNRIKNLRYKYICLICNKN